MDRPESINYNSEMLAFKTAVGDLLDTGTIAYLMDNCDSYMYSKYKDTWYPQQ